MLRSGRGWRLLRRGALVEACVNSSGVYYRSGSHVLSRFKEYRTRSFSGCDICAVAVQQTYRIPFEYDVWNSAWNRRRLMQWYERRDEFTKHMGLVALMRMLEIGKQRTTATASALSLD